MPVNGYSVQIPEKASAEPCSGWIKEKRELFFWRVSAKIYL